MYHTYSFVPRFHTHQLPPSPFFHITIHNVLLCLPTHQLPPGPFIHVTIYNFIPYLHIHRHLLGPFLHITIHIHVNHQHNTQCQLRANILFQSLIISSICHTQSSSCKFLVHTHIQTRIPSSSISIIQEHIKPLITFSILILWSYDQVFWLVMVLISHIRYLIRGIDYNTYSQPESQQALKLIIVHYKLPI